MANTSLLLLAQDLPVITPVADAAPAAEVVAAPLAPAVPPWWHALLESPLSLAILFIFVTAIITVLIQQRRKDKCLKLLDDYHVSYINAVGTVIWGDLRVYSKGLEVIFDAPYQTRRGLYKTSALIYEKQLADCHAICRCVDGLTDREQRMRQLQIIRTFNPGPIRRATRALRNLLNTLKDAFNKALSTILGQMAKTKPGGVMSTQKGGIDQIGQTLLGAAGNSYEPILERHIGKPIVLQLQSPADPDKKPIDLPGFLADYTDQYIAVFNVEHDPIGEQTIEVTESVAHKGYKIDLTEQTVCITCMGPEILVVKSLKTAKRTAELHVALTSGANLELGRDDSPSITLCLERTRRVDIICPRSQATVYFGGEFEHNLPPRRQNGIAPEPEVEQDSDDPAE
jgi:hypothetical protein